MVERVNCCVPFCRRTKAAEILPAGCDEWLCQIHWQLVPSHIKRRRAKLRRIYMRSNSADKIIRIVKADAHLWNKCKVIAIEGAAGI